MSLTSIGYGDFESARGPFFILLFFAGDGLRIISSTALKQPLRCLPAFSILPLAFSVVPGALRILVSEDPVDIR